MDQKLRKFDKNNQNLGSIVDDLRTKQEQMNALISLSRAKIRIQSTYIQNFKSDIYKTSRHIDDHEQLKEAAYQYLHTYIDNTKVKNQVNDPDVTKEYENQKKYLESAVHSLKKRVEQEAAIHNEEHKSVMFENMKLIEAIGKMRLRVKDIAAKVKSNKSNNKQELVIQSEEPTEELGENDQEDTEQTVRQLQIEYENAQKRTAYLQQEIALTKAAGFRMVQV